jgi:hypothetical protein
MCAFQLGIAVHLRLHPYQVVIVVHLNESELLRLARVPADAVHAPAPAADNGRLPPAPGGPQCIIV